MLCFRVSESPHVLRVPLVRALPREGDRRVPGCRWKSTKQVTPTNSFPEKLLHSVHRAGEFEETLFQLDLILATPRHPPLALHGRIQKLLWKVSLGPRRWPGASVAPPPNTLGRGHSRPSRVGTRRGRRLTSPPAAWTLSPTHQQLHLAARPPSPPEARNRACTATNHTTERHHLCRGAAGRRMRDSVRTPPPLHFRSLPEVKLQQRKAAAVSGNLTGRRVFCLCKRPKLKSLQTHHSTKKAAELAALCSLSRY